MELGNILFNGNINQRYECPEDIVECLKTLRNALNHYFKKQRKLDYDNPFDNTGNSFKNDVFEVIAYSWNDECSTQYNFKYKDIEISWYKYIGRDTTINRQVTEDDRENMLFECLSSLS